MSHDVENQDQLDSSPENETTFDDVSTLPHDDTSIDAKNLYSFKLIFSVIVSCLSSVQYGYHMAEMNAPEAIYSCQKSVPGPWGDYTLSYFGRHGYEQCIPLNGRQIGIVTSLFSIGGLLGSIYAGALADKFGRKAVFSANAILFVIGSSVETMAANYAAIVIGRLISGFGAGCGIVVTPLYINEISPLELRGTLGSMNQVSINIGILLTQLLAVGWANNEQWRLLLFTGVVIGALNFLGVFCIDDSPKWLTLNDREDEGFNSLMALRNNNTARCKYELSHWAKLRTHQRLHHKPKVSLYQYLTSPTFQNSKKIVTVIMVGQQLCGINSIVFYGVKVLISLFPNSSVAINCAISALNAFITFRASFVIDKLGRKPMLLTSVALMMCASLAMGVGIIFGLSALSVTSTFIYVGAFAIGLGPIPFLLIAEVSQNEVKGLAQSYGTTLNWLATFLVGFLFPIINELIGGAVYFIFAAVCFLFVSFTHYQLPETKGKHTYEEVWGIRPE